MTSRTITKVAASIGAVCLLGLTFTSHAEQPGQLPAKPASGVQQKVDAKDRVPVAVARDRAILMHELYESTLHAMHRHYFRSERATLPARAMEDIFDEMDSRTKADARWISVNTRAMSINHEPGTDIEKQAANEIAAGKDHFEVVQDGYYHRATPIPLGAGCVGCHNGLLAPVPKTPRFAGLVISIPVQDN